MCLKSPLDDMYDVSKMRTADIHSKTKRRTCSIPDTSLAQTRTEDRTYDILEELRKLRKAHMP